MRRILLGGAVALGWLGVANAADMATKYPVKAPPAPVFDWTGFYLGGYYGNSITHATASTPAPGVPIGTHAGAVGVVDGGWSGGVTAGYNWQFAPTWLVGVEGDFGYLGGKRLFKDWDDVIAVGEQNNWYATARGRIGFVTGPALLYATGGIGFVNATDAFGGNSGAGLSPTSSTTTTAGGVFGVGIETKLSRNWTAKTEYLYIDGGGVHSFGSAPSGIAGTPTDFTHNYQVIKTGLNYRFDGAWDGLPFSTSPQFASNHNWNGFYAGGNAGVGTSLTQTFSPNGDEDLTGTGFAGGGEAGYNYMLWNKYLIGVEGDFGALSMARTVNDWFDTNFAMFSQKTNWYGTARVRLGTSTGPALFYITGGGAWVNVQDGFQPQGALAGQLNTRTASGWTFGGGTEVALDQHWSAKLETLYISSGTSPTFTIFPGFTTAFKDRFTVVRAGLNYAFN
jgi:outer membrane immunogenic protein